MDEKLSGLHASAVCNLKYFLHRLCLCFRRSQHIFRVAATITDGKKAEMAAGQIASAGPEMLGVPWQKMHVVRGRRLECRALIYRRSSRVALSMNPAALEPLSRATWTPDCTATFRASGVGRKFADSRPLVSLSISGYELFFFELRRLGQEPPLLTATESYHLHLKNQANAHGHERLLSATRITCVHPAGSFAGSNLSWVDPL
eukprot:1929497-Pleurochrysis_carterae.AAC.3